MFSCTLSICSTESVDGYSWGRTVAENMNFHSVVYDFFCHVIVPVPQESQIISVVLLHQKAVKQLLYACQDGNLFLTEPHQNSEERIASTVVLGVKITDPNPFMNISFKTLGFQTLLQACYSLVSTFG